MSMEGKSGQWYADDCNEKKHPICGPPFNEAATYTSYFRVDGFDSLIGLKKMLTTTGRTDYICKEPYSVECKVEHNDGHWVTNYNMKRNELKCDKNEITCSDQHDDINCSTFEVRFYCPATSNQCESLKNENITACSGGRTCIPIRNHFLCRCPSGTKWNHQKQKCYEPCGVCSAGGDPHYVTYAKQRYDFMGTCMYKFAGVCALPEFENSPNFDVYTINSPCGAHGASCIAYIEVHLRNIVFMKGGNKHTENFIFKVFSNQHKYFYNGEAMDSGILEVEGVFKVKRRPYFFHLYSSALSLTVSLSHSLLSVDLPEQFVDKMCGLCGDCTTDKFRMKDLSLVTVKKAYPNSLQLDNADIINVANQWIMAYEGSNPQKCKVIKPPVKCPPVKEKKLKSSKFCGIFKDNTTAISNCFSAIDPRTYYTDCLFDACFADPNKYICESVRVYVKECMKKNILIDWRSDEFCPMDCGTKEYRADASCAPMCGNQIGSEEVCNESPEEGCVCPNGLKKRGEECVKSDDCGCDYTDDFGVSMFLKPGEKRLLSNCEKEVSCEADNEGSMETKLKDVNQDVNSNCVTNPFPKIVCIRGYRLKSDNVTCERMKNTCIQKYSNENGMCINIRTEAYMWRIAVYFCNNQDGTLLRLSTKARLDKLVEIMEDKKYEQVYISGQVKAKVIDDKVEFTPLLDKSKRGKMEYYNFDYHIASWMSIELSENVNVDDLKGKTTILALTVKLGPNMKPSIVAVPRNTVTNFVCEERFIKENEEKWYGPCNSDNNMANGDHETKKSLKLLANCMVCPHPLEVECVKVNSRGTVIGDCGMTKAMTYYSCNEGKRCIDHAVKLKCARDIDECKLKIHDCSEHSKCINKIGAYICNCQKNDNYPLMVNGICEEKKICRLHKESGKKYNLVSLPRGLDCTGYIYYRCPFKIFETCEKNYDPKSKLPLISTEIDSKVINGQTSLIFRGWIKNPITNEMKYFLITPAFFKLKKIMIGNSKDTMYLTNFGYCSKTMKTKFHLVPSNTLKISGFENLFKILIKFIGQQILVQIVVPKYYSDLACGMCNVKPSCVNNAYHEIPLFYSQVKQFSGKLTTKTENCAKIMIPDPTTTSTTTTTTSTTTTTTTPEPTTTTTTTTPEPTTTTTTTTPEPTTITTTTTPKPTTTTTTTTTLEPTTTTTTTTTPEPTTTTKTTTTLVPIITTTTAPIDCDEDILGFCNSLNKLCFYDKTRCHNQLCESTIGICAYLDVVNDMEKCRIGNDMDIFLDNLNCDRYCQGEDMSFGYTGGLPLERCQQVDKEDEEIANAMSLFGCQCDKGYKFSGTMCVKEENCGCTMEDGNYLEQDDVIINSQCTTISTCIGNNDLEERKMMCNKHATCENTITGYKCVCMKGFKGDGVGTDGCKPPDEEDETKICYSTTNDEGIIVEQCDCKTGYISNCTGCIDLNECTAGEHTCDLSKEKCENVVGNYTCSCADGFEAFNGDCNDIDECKKDIAHCGVNEGCENTLGGYNCKCCAGFKLDYGNNECVRNTNSEVQILVDQPNCCLYCDEPELCEESEANQKNMYCYIDNGESKQFSSYKTLFQHYCVNNIYIKKKNVIVGSCPKIVATTLPSANTDPLQPSTTDYNGNGIVTTLVPQITVPPTENPIKYCFNPNFCFGIAVPREELLTGKVCGPSMYIQRKTFENYCKMAIFVCKIVNGPKNMPPEPIEAISGACTTIAPPTTTTTTTTTTTPSPPVEPTTLPVTAPVEQTTRMVPVATTESIEPNVGEWSPWETCKLDNKAFHCGRGVQTRVRQVLDEFAIISAGIDSYEERVCFKPCDPNHSDFNRIVCPEDSGICGDYESKVCGSIGRGAADTYDNECELNIKACHASAKPAVLSKGECDEAPPQLCEKGPQEIEVKHDHIINGLHCIGEMKTIGICGTLACKGGFENCCVPNTQKEHTKQEKITAQVECMNNKGIVMRRYTITYPSAKTCKCSQQENPSVPP